MAHDVFISYASEDRATADAVCQGLEAAGVRCWVAPRDIPPGVEWPGAIVEAIAQSRALVLIFSAYANTSHQIPREIERAVAKRIPVISFRTESVEPASSLEYFIGVVQWVDALAPPLEPAIAQVAATVQALIAETPPSSDDTRRRPFRTAVELLQRRLRLRNTVVIASVAVAVVVSLLALMSVLDLFTLDTRIASLTMWATRPLATPVLSADVAMVALEAGVPRSEWRRRHAAVVDRLSAAGAKVIAFDMYFELPTPDDGVLADAIERARRRGTTVIVGANTMADGLPKLLPALGGKVSSWGMLCVGEKLGSAWIEPLAVEKSPPAGADRQPIVWSLALRAVAAFRGLDVSIDQIDSRRQEIFADHVTTHRNESFRFSSTRVARRFQKGCPIIGEGDRVHSLMVALSPLTALRDDKARRFTYSAVIGPTAPAGAPLPAGIVVLGVESADDTLEVPGGERRFGFELHADAINALLGGVAIRPLGPGAQLAISIGLALLGGTIGYARPSVTRRWRGLALAVTAAVYVVITLVVYSRLHLLLSPLYHLGGLLGAYVVAGKVEDRWLR